MTTLKVQNLEVSYGSLKAVSGMTFDCNAGEILGIIGPNGAGKSSTFNAITNRVTKSGSVTLAGANLDHVPTHDMHKFGLKRTFQQNSFFAELSVLRNVELALGREFTPSLPQLLRNPLGWAGRERRRREIAERLLADFHIPREYFHLRPDEIPYGTQRLLSIAMCFGTGATVLLADEPAAGIGGEDMEVLSEILIKIRAMGVAVVLIEHHMDLVMKVCDRIAVIDRGVQIAYGTPREIQADPKVRAAYLGGDA